MNQFYSSEIIKFSQCILLEKSLYVWKRKHTDFLIFLCVMISGLWRAWNLIVLNENLCFSGGSDGKESANKLACYWFTEVGRIDSYVREKGIFSHGMAGS